MVQNTLLSTPARQPGKFVCWFVAVVELAAVITITFGAGAAVDPERVRTDVIVSDESKADSSGVDADLAAAMLGVWEDDYKGHRILTLRPDGTGTMIVELDGVAAVLFASRLTFHEEWTVQDQRVTMKAVGGDPSGEVKLVLSLHGDSSTQRIVKVTEDRMVLVEEPSETRFEWRRVSDLEITTLTQ